MYQRKLFKASVGRDRLDSGYYERYMLSKETLLPESVKKLGENPFWIHMLWNFWICQMSFMRMTYEKR